MPRGLMGVEVEQEERKAGRGELMGRMEHGAVTLFLFDLIFLNRLPERSFQKWEVGPFQNGKRKAGRRKNEEFRDESVARRWWRTTLGVLQGGWSKEDAD